MKKRRKGSVLLQTLTMCMVLSYVAVTLVQWALSRYMKGARTYNNSVLTVDANATANTVISGVDQSFNGVAIGCNNIGITTSKNEMTYSVTCKKEGDANRYKIVTKTK